MPKSLFAAGSQRDDFFKREEVRAYLKDVEDKAMSEFGKGISPAGLNLGKSNGSSLFLSGSCSFDQSIDATSGSNPSFHGDLDAALINSSPDEDMAILDQLLELQQGESDYENDQTSTENAINKVDEELHEQEKLLGNYVEGETFEVFWEHFPFQHSSPPQTPPASTPQSASKYTTP